MKVLFIADEEYKGFWDFYDPERLRDIELIISCGDLSPHYLEFIETMKNVPLLYVRGNHDSCYDSTPPLGCIDIDDRIYDYEGIRILGLGGSMRYIPGKEDQYTEEEMQQRIRRLNRQITLMNGFDILVTHSPARGYGDMDDRPHQGFACFNDLMEKYKPKYMFHGHVHGSYSHDFQRERIHPSGTKIINAYNYYICDITDEDHPPRGKTGSALYDFYVSMQQRRKRS